MGILLGLSMVSLLKYGVKELGQKKIPYYVRADSIRSGLIKIEEDFTNIQDYTYKK